MQIPVDSFAAKTARACLRDLDRAKGAWLNLASSKDPVYVARALGWLGRHLSEYAWRMEVSFEVDALGAQLVGPRQIDRISEEKGGTGPRWTGLDKTCPDLSKNLVPGTIWDKSQLDKSCPGLESPC